MDGNNARLANYTVTVFNGIEIVDIAGFQKLADARAFARYWNGRTSYTTGTTTEASIINCYGKFMKVM